MSDHQSSSSSSPATPGSSSSSPSTGADPANGRKAANPAVPVMYTDDSDSIESTAYYLDFKRTVALRKSKTTITYPKTNSAGEATGEMCHHENEWQWYEDGTPDLHTLRQMGQLMEQQQQTTSTTTAIADPYTTIMSTIPLVCFGGISGHPDQYFELIMNLCPRGYWVISVDIPVVRSFEEFILAFDAFLTSLHIQKAHLLGAQLGGFLLQVYAQAKPERVASMVLCNTFVNNAYIIEHNPFSDFYGWMPEFMLKRMVLKSFPRGAYSKNVVHSIDYMISRLERLKRKEIASRLALQCTERRLQKESPIDDNRISIIDTLDETIYPTNMREAVYRKYPGARSGLMKHGNVFPYLSVPEEFCMHVHVHLRRIVQMIVDSVEGPAHGDNDSAEADNIGNEDASDNHAKDLDDYDYDEYSPRE